MIHKTRVLVGLYLLSALAGRAQLSLSISGTNGALIIAGDPANVYVVDQADAITNWQPLATGEFQACGYSQMGVSAIAAKQFYRASIIQTGNVSCDRTDLVKGRRITADMTTLTVNHDMNKKNVVAATAAALVAATVATVKLSTPTTAPPPTNAPPITTPGAPPFPQMSLVVDANTDTNIAPPVYVTKFYGVTIPNDPAIKSLSIWVGNLPPSITAATFTNILWTLTNFYNPALTNTAKVEVDFGLSFLHYERPHYIVVGYGPGVYTAATANYSFCASTKPVVWLDGSNAVCSFLKTTGKTNAAFYSVNPGGPWAKLPELDPTNYIFIVRTNSGQRGYFKITTTPP